MQSLFKSTILVFLFTTLGILLSCKDDEFVNSNPTIQDQSFSIVENSKNGTVVGRIEAEDPDEGQILFYEIISGNTDDAFAVNSNGQLIVGNSTALDFESNSSFTLDILIEDDQSGSAEGKVTISLKNLNETHSVASQSFSIDENSMNGTIVGIIQFSDPEGASTFTFEVIDGDEDGVFTITNEGVITVSSSCELDFERTEEYQLNVKVSDSDYHINTQIDVNVNDVELITNNGLVAYYPFNGNSNDGSINSNDGTISGASLTDDRNGCTNSAYSFDGIDDFIDVDLLVDDVINNTSGTISFWMKPANSSIGSSQRIFSLGDGSSNTHFSILIYEDSDSQVKVRNEIKANSDYVFALDANYDETMWSHIVTVQDGNSAKIYINNKLVSQSYAWDTDIGGWIDDLNNINNARIGNLDQNFVVQSFFEGSIDELRIYNRALTSLEIENLYQEIE